MDEELRPWTRCATCTFSKIIGQGGKRSYWCNKLYIPVEGGFFCGHHKKEDNKEIIESTPGDRCSTCGNEWELKKVCSTCRRYKSTFGC